MESEQQPTKKISYLNREIKKLSTKLDEIEQQRNVVICKINEKREKIKEICVHPKEHVKEKHKSFSGGYDYVSEYHTWAECNICGAVSETKIEYGSYS